MRLALIHKQLGGGGGLEKYLLGFAQQLRDADHDVHVVTQKVVAPDEEIAGIRIHRVPKTPIVRTLRLLRFCSDSKSAAAEIGADIVLGFGQTVDQDIHRAGGGCHRVYSEMLPPWKRFSPKNRVELRLEKQLYTSGRTKRFVVNASKVAKELEAEYNVDPDLITVIHTPVDSTRFRPADDAEKSAGDRLTFLYAAMDHTRKGLDVILQIWPEVDADLIIAGPPLNSDRKQRVDSMAEKITYVGQTADMPRLFQSADVFLHPTKYDACANTVLQAMSTGLPSIVSVRDGATDFIDNGETGFRLQNPTDPAELLKLVQSMSKVDRAKIGANARARMKHQTWAQHIDDWMNLVQKAAPLDTTASGAA